MSTVCYCGQPDCPVTVWEHDACVANLRAERDEARRLMKMHRDNAQSLGNDIAALVGMKGEDGDRLRAMVAAAVEERDALKAQVEAARALCRDQLDHGKVEADDLAGRILDAMGDVVR